MIVDELLKRGPAEVGLTRHGRTVVELEPCRDSAGSAARRSRRSGAGDLVVISGGARGITAEVAVALAAAFQPRLVVLGRSPAPAPKTTGLPGSTTRPS